MAMIATPFACLHCGKVSRGSIVDHHFKLELHCPFCSSFIRYTQMSECNDFMLYFGQYEGRLVSNIMGTYKGYKYLESLLDTKQSLRDWQRYVIDKLL